MLLTKTRTIHAHIRPTIGLDWQKNNFAREIGSYGHFLAIVAQL